MCKLKEKRMEKVDYSYMEGHGNQSEVDEVHLHRRRQNLRQKYFDVQEYTEEFQKLCLRSKVVEEESINLARYLNGLKWKFKKK